MELAGQPLADAHVVCFAPLHAPPVSLAASASEIGTPTSEAVRAVVARIPGMKIEATPHIRRICFFLIFHLRLFVVLFVPWYADQEFTSPLGK